MAGARRRRPHPDRGSDDVGPLPADGPGRLPSRPRLAYRPDIDGLRAVAVVAVGLFHAGPAQVAGGYVGVDVFFVISGYLITALILQDLEAGRFRLADFYARRARRILPALFLLLAVGSVLAYLWMLPFPLESFGKSVLATSLFANNLLLVHQSGYWDLAAERNPLLHTWSLGVEEQYYLTFPVLLMLGWRYAGRHIWILLSGLAVASLCLALVLRVRAPVADFYLLPTRAWEFLLGSLATRAVRQGFPARAGILGAQRLSGLGALLVMVSILTFGRRTAGPSLYTVLPACGTALVIVFSVEGTLVRRLLSSRGLVGVGLISYSLYLWQVPTFAFARIYCIDRPRPVLLAALFLATFPLAYLSWRFVEVPFRDGRVRPGRALAAGAALVSLLFAGYGGWLTFTRGVPTRLYPEDASVPPERFIAYNEGAFRFRHDAFPEERGLKILVTGNSFARDFINMTVETFDLRGIDIVYRDDARGCIPTWTAQPVRGLLERADVVVLAGSGFDETCLAGNLAFARDHAKTLFYIGTKDFGANLNWIARLGHDERRNRSDPLPDAVARAEASMARAVPPENYVSLLAPIVSGDRVTVTDDAGRLLSQDGRHLTADGARYVGRQALVNSALGRLLRHVSP